MGMHKTCTMEDKGELRTQAVSASLKKIGKLQESFERNFSDFLVSVWFTSIETLITDTIPLLHAAWAHLLAIAPTLLLDIEHRSRYNNSHNILRISRATICTRWALTSTLAWAWVILPAGALSPFRLSLTVNPWVTVIQHRSHHKDKRRLGKFEIEQNFLSEILHQLLYRFSYRQHMTGYPQDPKQMQAAYSSQQNMMSGMIPQQGYGSISQHQQQAQQRISSHYPQSGHQMYPTPPQQAPAPQPYGGYGVQHQNSRSSAAQHPGYGHTGLDQSSYGHIPNQGPVGLPPIAIQQTQQSHLSQTPQSHQQQQQLHQLQHPSMNPTAQPPVLGASHGGQQTQAQQSHLTPQGQHASSAMHHSSNASQHQSAMGPQQASQPSHQIPQGHNPLPMPHQMGHGMGLPSYGSQMTAVPSAAPPQVPSYLPNSKQTPATQQHGSSPQYRAPFPQLSPQMSPRPQMSPHPQMSPRPLMSPAKPPTQQTQNVQQQSSSNVQSPHSHMPGISSPNARSQPLPPIQTNVKSSSVPTSAGGVSNTLQALEQMVMPVSNPAPGMDYNQASYRQQALPSMPNNPLSPLGSRVTMSPQHQQHQQWPTHRSQMNGNGHHGMMPQNQLQMQQQQMQQSQSAAGMMGQMPDMMSASQPLQVIPPSNQHQQPTSYSYEEISLTSQPQKSSLDSIHKPYENLTSSLPSQQMGNLMNQTLISPTLQNQPQQMDTTQDPYGNLQTNQSTMSALESTDQSSDLNLLDSYSNSATVNTSNMSSTAQKSSIEDSLLSQNTNDNSQCSHISDNANNMMQASNFGNEISHDDNANQQSMEQDLPCLEPADVSDEYQKVSETEHEQASQDSQEQNVGLDKADELQFGFEENQGLKPKSADSTMINETEKDISSEMTSVVPDITVSSF